MIGSGSVSCFVDLAYCRRLLPELVTLRRTLHRFPELGFELPRTSALIRSVLATCGVETVVNSRCPGIVGLIQGEHPGGVVALRADLDALPIDEQTRLDFASQVKGAMHACGHDLHTACLLGAMQLLAAQRGSLHGTVKLIFQPAEEIDAGAKAMIAAGVLQDPPVDAIFGLHNFPGLPTGTIAVRDGPLMAALDAIEITVHGQGGHGGVPDQSIDAIVAASSIVLQLQTIVSRNVSPFSPAVVSLGTFTAGVADNVVADRAVLTGTIRTLDPKVRASLPGMITRVVEEGSRSLGAAGQCVVVSKLPVLVNDVGAVAVVREAARCVLGNDKVKIAAQTMGAEDFSAYLEHVPGCFFWLGATVPGRRSHGWHHPTFDVDENALLWGSTVLAETAIRFLRSTADRR